MMIVSAKISKRKLFTGLAAAVCVIALLVFLSIKSNDAAAVSDTAVQSTRAATNEDRIAYLASFGWQVKETPEETQEVRIPEEFNDVFTRYNQLQQSQGFDLSAYAGKTAKRYVYAITNYPGGSTDHYVTLLVHKNEIIGGDVTSTAEGGKMHGFQRPAATSTAE